MEFRSSNRLNVLLNKLSGNFLPVSAEKTTLSFLTRTYAAIVWFGELMYVTCCVVGMLNVPREKVLKDGTVNILVSLEGIALTIHLHNRKHLLRELIGNLNRLLLTENEALRRVTRITVKPLERPLKIYTIASITSVVVWSSLPILQVFRKCVFHYRDYRIPAALSKEPFSATVFIAGNIFLMLGSTYTILRKISLDIYTMHLILSMTAQYRYLRMRFATVLRGEKRAAKNLESGVTWQNVSCRNDGVVQHEMRLLAAHYGIVIRMAGTLRRLLSPNIGVLYINNVFKFCFLSFMFVTTSAAYFDKTLIVFYSIGALTQLYILCSCIDVLLEASTVVSNDAFHEKWYQHDIHLQRTVAVMIAANKLECRLSSFRNINLTLPSFMSILNQAYTVCLLFLKVRHE